MRFLSLFSGVGGLDLGLERAGLRVVAQVEIDPFCNLVLEKHWPGLPRWKDIRDVTTAAILAACGHPDCIAGGFACTDLSIAGKGAGLGKTTRSGLTWRNMFRLIRGLRPAWLVIENVPALRSRGSDRVIAVLERIGYTCWPVVVGAWAVGAPHKRDRVWIVGRFTLDNTTATRWAWNAGPGEMASIRNTARREQSSGSSSGKLAHSRRERLPERRTAGDMVGSTGEAEVDSEQRERMRNAVGDGCATLADPMQPGREEQHIAAIARWPSRPGQPQHEWEPSRLVKFEVGAQPDELPPGLVRSIAEHFGIAPAAAEMWAKNNRFKIDRIQNKLALKAAGNAVVPQVALLIGRWLMDQWAIGGEL